MVQQWHPDLYKPGSLMQKTAEDITKEANEAYGQLYRKKLYRQYPPKEEGGKGSVPAAAEAATSPAPEAPVPRAAPRGSAGSRRSSRPPRRPRSTGRYPDWEECLFRILRARRTKVMLGSVLALAALPLAWAIWESFPSSASSRPGPAPAPEAAGVAGPAVKPAAAPRATAAGTAPAPSAVPPVARDPNRPFGEFAPDPSLRALAASTRSMILPEVIPPPDPDPLGNSAALIRGLFEMGDTQAKVLSVEGSPDTRGDTVYRYGSSLVYFRAGRVRGWVDRLPRLRVRSWDSIPAPSIERFSLGSSRDDVVRAQGSPGAFTADAYLFGSSAVYFANGRVSGWSEGGVALKVLDLPPLPFRDPGTARSP